MTPLPQPMRELFIKLRNGVLDFLFPPRCVHCRAEGAFLCLPCLRGLKVSPSLLHHPPAPTALSGLMYVFKYRANPALKAAIYQFKYRFNTEMATLFAALLLKKITRSSFFTSSSPILIPVPLHRRRLAWRGFNQAEALSCALQRLAGIPVIHGLQRVKATEQQAMLSRSQRLKNLKNSFIVLPALLSLSRDTSLFLVDDVYTTGTTLNECARALRKTGFKNVHGLVIAKT
ncbi:ComF family protein [Candidatus Peregrinibacteria bacterium]|nr:ComF family protein [Candidatus Peregrinibacteria bacterium]